MTNDRETENARERLAVRLRETLGAAVREIRPSPQDGIALDVFAGSLPDVAAAAPKLKDAGFWPLPDSQRGRTLFLAGADSADGPRRAAISDRRVSRRQRRAAGTRGP